ncbi:MAG: hypothetical protein ACRC80_36020 [Waterburya sp.]
MEKVFFSLVQDHSKRSKQISVVLDQRKQEDWKMKMSERNYIIISATIFTIVALLHLVRLFTHWSFQFGAVIVPLWGSWLALIIGTALSIWAFRLLSQWKISHQ